MTLQEAKDKIRAEFSIMQYAEPESPEIITLDGTFSREDLRAILRIMGRIEE